MNWLSIPLDKLRWEDIPSTVRKDGRAIVILALREMPYREYLLTNHWLDIRAHLLALDGYRCTLCPAKCRILNVHHLTYERRGFEEMEDLRTLCDPCHALMHESELHQTRARLHQELSRQ